MMRTQIEVTVQQGVFTDQELFRLLDGLSPLENGAVDAVRQAPYHQLNYWCRYRMRTTGGPHGLWQYRNPHPYDGTEMASLEDLREKAPLKVLVPDPSVYYFDSGVAINCHDVCERYVEVILRHCGNGSDHFWIVAAAANSSNTIALPPKPEDYPAETRKVIQLRKTDVASAALREPVGAWEALWEEDGVFYAAWAGSSQFLEGGEFKDVVDSLQVVG